MQIFLRNYVKQRGLIRTISFFLRQQTGANCQSLVIFKFKMSVGLSRPTHINNFSGQIFFNLHPYIIVLDHGSSSVHGKQCPPGTGF